MNDGDALLTAILTYPEEDTPRLVYADWLQEQSGPVGSDEYFDNWYGRFLKAAVLGETYPIDGIWGHRLFGREIYAALEPFVWVLDGKITYHTKGSSGQQPATTRLHVARGFVEHIELPVAAFIEHAEAIFSRHPVRAVAISNALADPNATTVPSWSWWEHEGHGQRLSLSCIPKPIFDLMPGEMCYDAGEWRKTYLKQEGAEESLKAGALAFGRQKAGLPPLPEPAPHR